MAALVGQITIMDFNDPIQLIIESSGGAVFKNGIGHSSLVAKLFQNNKEIDESGTKYNYSWKVLDKDGNLRTFADGSPFKVGKTISVGIEDVEGKSTFVCSIS
jgi:hypothetical protein